MDTQRNYQAKFSLLNETTPKTQNKKCIWIWVFVLISSVGFFSAFLYWMIFGTPCQEQVELDIIENISTDSTLTDFKKSKVNLFKKKLWEPGMENCLELIYPDVEFQKFLPASFNIYSRKNLKIALTSIYGYMNMDLILYYERIINEYNVRTLKEIFENYQNELGGSQDLLKFIDKLKIEKFKFYSEYLHKNNLTAETKYFVKFIKLTDELKDWYVYLENLRGFLSRYDQQKHRDEYYQNITEKNFLKYTKLTQEVIQRVSNTFNVTEKKLKEISEVIEEWMSPSKIKFENKSLIISNKVILISEVNDQLKILNESAVKSLHLFAGHTVYLDEDLTLPGVDVVIMAPKWIFFKKISINLSGRGGAEFHVKTATEGNPGQPGSPGESSGHFLGVGEMNKKFLILSTNGGKGGDGQNGARGRDGENNTNPGPPIEKPVCVEKIGNFENPFGQIITHYKIFNEIGCGGSGTDGGAGGVGGKGGRVVLIDTENMSVTVSRGKDGLNGSPGEGGKGGKGGRDGCYYEVFDVDDEILHRVTTTKCQLNVLPSGINGKQGGNFIQSVSPATKENLSTLQILYSFYEAEEKDLLKFNDTETVSFIKKLIENDLILNSSDSYYSLLEYDLPQKFSRIDLLKVLDKKIDSLLLSSPKNNFLIFLKTLVLGEELSFQKNKNYLFIDFDNYLSELEKKIKNLNESLTNYSLSKISKNVKIKISKLNKNFNSIKSELTALNSESNKSAKKFLSSTVVNSKTYKNLAVALEERRILYITQTLADLMIHFVTLIQNPSFSNKEFKNFLARHSLYYNEMQRKKEKFFDVEDDLSPREKRILSHIVMKPSEFEKHSQKLKNITCFVSDVFLEEMKLAKVWDNFSDEINFLKEVRDLTGSLSKSKALSIEGKISLQSLTDELDHFVALFYYIDRKKIETSFLKYLNNMNLDSENLKLGEKLKNVMISMEYNLAVDATQLKVQPFKSIKKLNLTSKNIAHEALTHINDLRRVSKQTTVCKNFREGIFDKTSVLGDFYCWSNSEIRTKLKKLFTGRTISLKSSLNNRHILDKNFIKLKLLKLEFDNSDPSLRRILNNFQIEMTHSGYSYYNWGGESYIVISEEVTLEYGFKTNNDGHPEVYNTLYKKLQSGEFMLSPYTTWAVRLTAINNEANFDQLTAFVNTTDLRLAGTGTFIS